MTFKKCVNDFTRWNENKAPKLHPHITCKVYCLTKTEDNLLP